MYQDNKYNNFGHIFIFRGFNLKVNQILPRGSFPSQLLNSEGNTCLSHTSWSSN